MDEELTTEPTGENGAASDAAKSKPRVLASTFETDRHYRTHRSYIWLRPILMAALIIVIIFSNSIDDLVQFFRYLADTSDQVNWPPIVLMIIGGLLAVYGITVALSAISYRHLSFVFGEREFSLYSGVFNKHRMHVPYNRVQSVSHRASLIQRIAGVCTVTVESAGGSGNTALKVPYLTLGASERLRRELMARKALMMEPDSYRLEYQAELDFPTDRKQPKAIEEDAGKDRVAGAPVQPKPVADAGVSGARETARAMANDHAINDFGAQMGSLRGVLAGDLIDFDERPTYECGLSNGQLLMTALSHSSTAALTIVTFITGTCVAIPSFAMAAGSMSIGGLVAIVVGIMLLGIVAGTVASALMVGGFKARRVGDRLEVESGMLSHQVTVISVDRIQTVNISQTFVRRLIGYCEVTVGHIESVDENSNSNSKKMSQTGLVIHPFVRLSDAEAVIDGLLPEFGSRPHASDLAPVPHVALRRALIRKGILYNFWLWIALIVLIFVGVLAQTVPDLAGDPYGALALRITVACVLALFAVGTAWQLADAVLWARRSGHMLNSGYLALYNAGMSTSMVMVPRRKVQSLAVRTNPFQRRAGVATLRISTAATQRISTSLLDVTSSEGEAALAWIRPRRRSSAPTTAASAGAGAGAGAGASATVTASAE
jgi:putative membrane protein